MYCERVCSGRACLASDVCSHAHLCGAYAAVSAGGQCGVVDASLYRYRAGERFLLHGFVVMPDHVHLLFSPAAAMEQAVGLIKGGFSFAVRKQYRGPV